MSDGPPWRQYWVRRKLEASAALPAACVLGEQVSLVVTLVNRDHRLAKVNLVLGKSTHYRFVNLQELGKQVSLIARGRSV